MEGSMEVLDALNRFSAKMRRVKLLLARVYRLEAGLSTEFVAVFPRRTESSLHVFPSLLTMLYNCSAFRLRSTHQNIIIPSRIKTMLKTLSTIPASAMAIRFLDLGSVDDDERGVTAVLVGGGRTATGEVA
jgi:hypothetical protein